MNTLPIKQWRNAHRAKAAKGNNAAPAVPQLRVALTPAEVVARRKHGIVAAWGQRLKRRAVALLRKSRTQVTSKAAQKVSRRLAHHANMNAIRATMPKFPFRARVVCDRQKAGAQ